MHCRGLACLIACFERTPSVPYARRTSSDLAQQFDCRAGTTTTANAFEPGSKIITTRVQSAAVRLAATKLVQVVQALTKGAPVVLLSPLLFLLLPLPLHLHLHPYLHLHRQRRSPLLPHRQSPASKSAPLMPALASFRRKDQL